MDKDVTSLLCEPLMAHEIDFRIKTISLKGYATILAYKNARVDMHKLNKVFGVNGWQRRHEVIDGNLYCSIGIRDEYDKNTWVWKQDVGTESMTEKEKGQASDAFKRAAFNLGIGIELYEYPFICVKLNDDEYQVRKNNKGQDQAYQTYKLRLKEWVWSNQFDENGKLCLLSAVDNNGNNRYSWGAKGINPATQTDARKEVADWFIKMNTCIRDNMDSIFSIKDCISGNALYEAGQAWFELSEEDQKTLFVAPSKGGIFTTEERDIIKNKLREAYYGGEK